MRAFSPRLALCLLVAATTAGLTLRTVAPEGGFLPLIAAPVVASSLLGSVRCTSLLGLYGAVGAMFLPLLNGTHLHDSVVSSSEVAVACVVATALSFAVATWKARVLVEEHRYRVLAENAADVVLRLNIGGDVDWVTPSVRHHLRWDPEQLTGHPFCDLLAAEGGGAFTGSGNGLEAINFHALVRAGDGEPRWMRCQRRPIIGGDGHLQASVVSMSDVDGEMRARQELHWLADHDSVTGLKSRNWITARLAELLQNPRQPALAMKIDLSEFAVVQQSLGYAAGDDMITQLASEVERVVPPGLHVGRWDGWLLAVVGIAPSDASIEQLAQSILDALAMERHVWDLTVARTASVGVAVSAPGSIAEHLLRDAADAVRRAKVDGRSRWFRVGAASSGAVQTRLEREHELREALTQNQFVLHLQPFVDLATRTTVGHEALVRWQHPVRGLVGPAEFIPIMEQSGLIAELGQQVVQMACGLLQRRPGLPGWLSVNVSPIELNYPHWLERLVDAMHQHELQPGRLAVELTETAIIQRTGQVREVLHGLATAGVPLLLDDFGSGYASIGVISEVPLSAVKLDQAFVRQLDGQPRPEAVALTKAVAALAEGLHLDTIAEGVETEAQAQRLLASGWQVAQGWLLGRPRPLTEFETTPDAQVPQPA